MDSKPTPEQLIQRGAEAERLLERVWTLIQGNYLTFESHAQPGTTTPTGADFQRLYNEVLDFDPGCIDWHESE